MIIDFQKNVETVLERIGMDQKDAAYKADKTPQGLRMILGYNSPTAATVSELAEAWDVSPRELILGPSNRRVKTFDKPLDVAGRIKAVMKREGIDEKELAKRMRWDSRGNAFHLFKTNNPQIKRLPELAEALGVELKELVK